VAEFSDIFCLTGTGAGAVKVKGAVKGAVKVKGAIEVAGKGQGKVEGKVEGNTVKVTVKVEVEVRCNGNDNVNDNDKVTDKVSDKVSGKGAGTVEGAQTCGQLGPARAVRDFVKHPRRIRIYQRSAHAQRAQHPSPHQRLYRGPPAVQGQPPARQVQAAIVKQFFPALGGRSAIRGQLAQWGRCADFGKGAGPVIFCTHPSTTCNPFMKIPAILRASRSTYSSRGTEAGKSCVSYRSRAHSKRSGRISRAASALELASNGVSSPKSGLVFCSNMDSILLFGCS
jgi:hypothetical protein